MRVASRLRPFDPQNLQRAHDVLLVAAHLQPAACDRVLGDGAVFRGARERLDVAGEDDVRRFRETVRRLQRAWSWGEGPAVLLVHGWGGHAAQFQSFVEPLVRAGFRAIAFDAPSHGSSGAPPRHAPVDVL
ncbi:MAG: alpha/beta hydrolase [Thermoanaerobaculia bacterium]